MSFLVQLRGKKNGNHLDHAKMDSQWTGLNFGAQDKESSAFLGRSRDSGGPVGTKQGCWLCSEAMHGKSEASPGPS